MSSGAIQTSLSRYLRAQAGGALTDGELLARYARGRDEEKAGAAPPAPPPDPLAEVSGRELLRAVDEELARLPEKYRLPVLLCCVQGLSREEAARQLGWSAGAVKGRLERGRHRLA